MVDLDSVGTLAELAPDATLAVDPSGRIMIANQPAHALFGYEDGTLVGRDVAALVPAQLRAEHAALVHGYFEQPTRRIMAVRRRLVGMRLDGGEVAIDVALAPLDTTRGVLVLASVRDLTEHDRLLSELASARERYRQILESASEVFYRVRLTEDPLASALEYVSPQCESITGLPPAHFLANAGAWFELVHPEDREGLAATTAALVIDGREDTRYYRLRDDEGGGYRRIADRVVPLRGAGGGVVGFQGTARDITEQAALEEDRQRLARELEQARKMETLGRLAGGIAHDFNNLLTVVIGCCDLAGEERGLSESGRDLLLEAANAARRGADLTRQLLGFSRQQVARPRVISIAEHLASFEGIIRRTLPRNIELALSIAQEPLAVRMDPHQVDQILLNLVSNARDAMPAGGFLGVDLLAYRLQGADPSFPRVPAGDYVLLKVSDTGGGMDAETVAHAFEPFFTTKGEGKGTGLGLPSVFGIAKQNGGYVFIGSIVGRGTTVTVLLPRTADEPDAASPLRQGDQVGALRILLVDDDASVRRTVRQQLERRGHAVIEAADPGSALRLLAECGSIDLLLTDVDLPALSGRYLAELCRRRRPGLSVALMSGSTGNLEPGHETSGPVWYLEKPIDARRLGEVLERAAEARGRRSES